MDMNNEKVIVLAFFDILGTSKLLNEGKYDKVYEYYQDMVELCNSSHTPIAVHNPFYGKHSTFSGFSGVIADVMDFDTLYHIINYDLHHAFFSDTFLLWIEVDSFLQPTLAGFLEKCCIVFCSAIRKGIPLRGVISAGSAIMDEKNRIFLGRPLAEAAKAEPQQNWMGVGLGESILNIHEMDTEYLLPYFNHVKEERRKTGTILGGWVLDWYSWWGHNYQDDVRDYINRMDTDERFSGYYRNSLSYVEVSKQRETIWGLFRLFGDLHKVEALCSLGNNLDDNQLKMRTQGVELMLSSGVNAFIKNVLSMDTSLWLDEKSRGVLLSLQDGKIMVDGVEYNLNSFKEIMRGN